MVHGCRGVLICIHAQFMQLVLASGNAMLGMQLEMMVDGHMTTWIAVRLKMFCFCATEGDAFILAFWTPDDAVMFAMEAQERLLKVCICRCMSGRTRMWVHGCGLN